MTPLVEGHSRWDRRLERKDDHVVWAYRVHRLTVPHGRLELNTPGPETCLYRSGTRGRDSPTRPIRVARSEVDRSGHVAQGLPLGRPHPGHPPPRTAPAAG